MCVVRARLLAAALALFLAGCGGGEDGGRSFALFNPPDIPPDSEAARLAETMPAPNVFGGPTGPARPAAMNAAQQQAMREDLEGSRDSHVDAARTGIEQRR